MRNKIKGDLFTAIIIMIAATVMAVSKFIDGQTVDGGLWCIISIATLLREIRRYMAKK